MENRCRFISLRSVRFTSFNHSCEMFPRNVFHLYDPGHSTRLPAVLDGGDAVKRHQQLAELENVLLVRSLLVWLSALYEVGRKPDLPVQYDGREIDLDAVRPIVEDELDVPLRA